MDLRASGPLEILDGALLAVRAAARAPLVRAWAGSAPLALCALGVYYVERVEGIRSCVRCSRCCSCSRGGCARWTLSGMRARVRAGDPQTRCRCPSPQTARPVDILCTASVVGLGLWVWLWLLVFAALITPLAAAGMLPFIALRGAVAPSWLARAACARERGLAAFGQAFDDTAGMRGAFLIVEMLALFGAIGLFGNLYALLSFSLLLGHALLGLDVAFVSSFLSPDNTLVLCCSRPRRLLLIRAAARGDLGAGVRRCALAARRRGLARRGRCGDRAQRARARRVLLRSEPPGAARAGHDRAGAGRAAARPRGAASSRPRTRRRKSKRSRATHATSTCAIKSAHSRAPARVPRVRRGRLAQRARLFDKLFRWLDQLDERRAQEPRSNTSQLPPVVRRGC